MFSSVVRQSIGTRCAIPLITRSSTVSSLASIPTLSLSTTANNTEDELSTQDPTKLYNLAIGIEETLKNPTYTPSRFSYPLLRHLDLKQLKSSSSSRPLVDSTGEELPMFPALKINPADYLVEDKENALKENNIVSLDIEPFEASPQQGIAEQMQTLEDKVEMKRTRNRRPLKPSRLVITGREFHPMNVWFLSRFVRKSGRIITRKESGLTAKQHRKLARTIRRARQLGYMPYQSQFHMGPLANAAGEVFPDGGKQNPLLPPINIVTEKEFFSPSPKKYVRYKPKELPFRTAGNREYAFPVDAPATGIDLYDLSPTFEKLSLEAKASRRRGSAEW